MALLLGGGYWLPVLHFHSEIWAACAEAEGGEGALGDAVLHSPLRSERLVDVIGRLVIEGDIDVTDVSVGRLCWNKGSVARAEIYIVDPLERQKKRQASGQQRGRRVRGRLVCTGRGRCVRPAVVADPGAAESSSSGDDAGMDAAAHEWLQVWGVPETSSDVEREGDADSEPRGLGIDVDDAQVTGKRDHAHAAAIAAERGDDARANRAWDDARRASEDEDGVREVAFEFLVGNFVEDRSPRRRRVKLLQLVRLHRLGRL